MNDEKDKNIEFWRVRDLPDPTLDKYWRDIVVDAYIKMVLFNFILIAPQMDPDVRRQCAIYAFALLYGPPGTGKTSLALGCANEVAKQTLARSGKRTKLLILKVATIFSAYLGESMKAVLESFEMVRFLARHNHVIMDLEEIETIGTERGSLGAGDPSDVMKSVAAFLTEIDELRFCKNVAIIGTSNLDKSIDRALWDRSDLKLYIGRPDADRARILLERSFARFRRLGARFSPSLIETFIETFYNGDSVTPFSSRDLCRLPMVAVCSKGRKDLANEDVLQAAESMLVENRKEKDYGSLEKEVVCGA